MSAEYPYAATLTPEKVREYVRAIAAEADDDERAHGMEDALYKEVLTAIAVGQLAGIDASLAALHALSTKGIEFARWYA